MPSSTPADRGSECDAELTHLALGAQRHQRLPQFVVADRLDAGVVQLQEIDAVGPKALQRSIDLRPHRSRPPVVRTLGLSRILAFGFDVVADLGRDDDVVSSIEVVAQDRFARSAFAVHGRGVEEVDALVERGLDHVVRIVGASPPVGYERPSPETDLRDDEIACSESAVTHDASVPSTSTGG